MSTTRVSAGQIMDRVANLLNDPNKTDYTYKVMIPYLNMAIEEFSDLISEANSPYSNMSSFDMTAAPIVVKVGIAWLVYPEYSTLNPGTENFPTFPGDLIEIQEIGERPVGSGGSPTNTASTGQPYRSLPRREFPEIYPTTNSLLFWCWERGIIRFNPNGANVDMEVSIRYIYQGIAYVVNENSFVDFIGSRTYLAYKTAAFCAMFIGENESRAKVLEDRADEALERSINISSKGRQQIMTRHRPFRAAYKSRGWM